jgi:phosphatidylglycerol:prolipoprotein diacylglycerol transferase
MHVVLLRIDALHLVVHSGPAMVVLAALFGLGVGPRWAEALDGVPRQLAFRVYAWLGVATFAGGHLHYAINYPVFAAGRLPWEGLHAGGAIVGLLVGAPAVFAYYRLHPGRLLDALMPAAGVGIFLGRLGCFLAGCCYGFRCTYPWCLSFPPGSLPAVSQAQQKVIPYDAWSLAVHPLQLYFGAIGLLITIVALWLIRRRRYQGQVALVSLLIFAAGAYWLEPLRDQERALRPYLAGVPQLQVVAGWLVGFAVVALILCEVGHRVLIRRFAISATRS